MSKPQSTWKKVLAAVRPYSFFVALSLLFGAVSVALTLYVPYLVGQTIDSMLTAGGRVDFALLFDRLLLIAVSVAVTALATWLMNLVNNRICYSVVRDLRGAAFARLEQLPLSYLDSHPHGDIVSRIIADAEQVSEGLLLGFSQFFVGGLTILATLVFMFTLHPLVTLVVLLLTPISLFVARFIAKSTHRLFREQSADRSAQTALIDETVSAAKLLAAYGMEEEARLAFEETNDRLEKSSLRAIFYSSLTNPSTRFVNSLVYAGVALAGAFAVIFNGMTVGVLSCFLSYANQYTKPFNEISGVITELQNALACAARLFELTEAEAESSDAALPALSPVTGEVTLSHVDFSYTPERPLICDFCLDVKAGQKVAIVGPTGCGKTTLINLLMRFYDVCGGQIAVDAQDIRRVTRDSLRASYGMVLQETWLRAATVRENIAMGRPDATDTEIEAAARAAHAHSFIKRLPDGYNTYIGEDGGSLSQGQRQLLCIARVMLTRPPMLILDEATSSIDTRTELRIQAAFDELMQGRTCFLVAHRLSTVREADIILVMRDGNVVEQGSHSDLLARGGFYHTLYHSQFAP